MDPNIKKNGLSNGDHSLGATKNGWRSKDEAAINSKKEIFDAKNLYTKINGKKNGEKHSVKPDNPGFETKSSISMFEKAREQHRAKTNDSQGKTRNGTNGTNGFNHELSNPADIYKKINGDKNKKSQNTINDNRNNISGAGNNPKKDLLKTNNITRTTLNRNALNKGSHPPSFSGLWSWVEDVESQDEAEVQTEEEKKISGVVVDRRLRHDRRKGERRTRSERRSDGRSGGRRYSDAAENAIKGKKRHLESDAIQTPDSQERIVSEQTQKGKPDEEALRIQSDKERQKSQAKPEKAVGRTDESAGGKEKAEATKSTSLFKQTKTTKTTSAADKSEKKKTDEDLDADLPDELKGLTSSGHMTGPQKFGYGFIIFILLTLFGSVTVAVYIALLQTKVTLPSILVNVSMISLLIFLFIILFRYLGLIVLSIMQHNANKNLSYELKPPYIKASILVPAYNEEVVIERSIKSLVDLDYPNFEVIVIDDGSKDDTLKLAKDLEGWHGNTEVRVFTQPNGGKSTALNHGARRATGEVVVCVDGDSRLHPNTLRVAMRHFQDPEITGVAGNVKVVNRRNILTRLQALEYIEGLNLVRRAQAYLKSVNIVPGPIGIFRKEAILDVGGWESDTFAEDCELTLKLLAHGYKIDYEPEAISYTEAPEEMIPLLKQRYRWTRGILQALRKHKFLLINPSGGSRIVITMWQMILEAVLWPLMNILANVMFLLVGILFGISPLIVMWWVQLSILDMIAAMHTVAIERERLYLVPYAFLYRVYFVQIVDFAKLAATIEEMLGVKMGWGKLKRTGNL